MALKVESKIGKSNCMDSDLFEFLSDFTKFTSLLPPQYKSNIQATPETCSINAGTMGVVVLHFIEKESPKLIKVGTRESKENITLWIQLKHVDSYDTRIRVTISVETGMLGKMMIKKQVQQFADSLNDAICQIQPFMVKQ